MTTKTAQKIVIFKFANCIFKTVGNQFEREIFLTEIRKKGFSNWDWFEVAKRIEIYNNDNDIKPDPTTQKAIDKLTNKQ